MERQERAIVFSSNKDKDASNDLPEHSVLQPTPEGPPRRHRRRWDIFASVLVVSLLVITSLSLFRHFSSAAFSNIPTGNPIGTPASLPVLAHTEVNGLESILSITPGPYFLSELLSVDITLTNHSQHTIMLGGGPAINTCNGAFGVTITGGQEPHYDVPGNDVMMRCPFGGPLDMKKSLSVHGYIPLTMSGAVTITMEVSVLTLTQDQNGIIGTQRSHLLDKQWPRIAITVAPQIPADRLFSLQAWGNNVIVNVPDIVRPHLVYFSTVTCLHSFGRNVDWDRLKVTILQEPDCADFNRHWTYAVSAPGYAIAAISMSL